MNEDNKCEWCGEFDIKYKELWWYKEEKRVNLCKYCFDEDYEIT